MIPRLVYYFIRFYVFFDGNDEKRFNSRFALIEETNVSESELAALRRSAEDDRLSQRPSDQPR